MIREMKFQPEKMQASLNRGFATATDLADYLVNDKKIPFREAHEHVGKLVSLCVQRNRTLADIDESDRASISEHFVGDSYFEAISLVKSTEKKNVYGGTARKTPHTCAPWVQTSLKKMISSPFSVKIMLTSFE